MTLYPEDLLRLLLAIVIGGMIGAERELRDKSAGLRTLMFISVGSTLFTILSLRMAEMGGGSSDPTRIAAQIVTGIGFLGAGAIIRNGGEVQGLTTASTIWLAAALGMGIGAGEYKLSIAAGILILLALIIFPSVERSMGKLQQVHTYRVVFHFSEEKVQSIQEILRRSDLDIMSLRYSRKQDEMTCTWRARGRRHAHETVLKTFLTDPDILEVEN